MKKQTLSDINGHLFYRCLVVELLQELVALKNMVGYMYLSVTGGLAVANVINLVTKIRYFWVVTFYPFFHLCFLFILGLRCPCVCFTIFYKVLKNVDQGKKYFFQAALLCEVD